MKYDIKDIQKALDEAKESWKGVTEAQINRTTANKIKATDPSWIAATTQANIVKAQSEEWKQAQKEGVRTNIHTKSAIKSGKKRRKLIVTPLGQFESQTDASSYFASNFELTPGFINYSLRKKPHLYYYLEDGQGEIQYETVSYSPFGAGAGHCGMSQPDMLKAAKEANEPNALLYNGNHFHWFNKMCKTDPDNYYKRKEPKREWLLCDNMGNPQYLYDYPKV